MSCRQSRGNAEKATKPAELILTMFLPILTSVISQIEIVGQVVLIFVYFVLSRILGTGFGVDDRKLFAYQYHFCLLLLFWVR